MTSLKTLGQYLYFWCLVFCFTCFFWLDLLLICSPSQVYTVGPDYAHAEARKSPALDGKVERDSEGKEIRYPVMLTAMEKLVARKVCLAFKVNWCYIHRLSDHKKQWKTEFYFNFSKSGLVCLWALICFEQFNVEIFGVKGKKKKYILFYIKVYIFCFYQFNDLINTAWLH